MTIPLWAVIGAALTIATPLIWATLGAIINERAGILNLGIEGTMYAGAFSGFLGAYLTGSLWAGLALTIIVGAVCGLGMALLSVTLGVNQHVAGLGLTLLLVAACDFANRLLFSSGTQTTVGKFGRIFAESPVFGQYPMTYVALLLVAPGLWWVLRSTGLGLRLRAVGENPEAADVAGTSVAKVRYGALVSGSILMALGGSFLTLSVLGTFTIDIVSGRGWVCIALVVFSRWRVWPAVAGALLFGLADAVQLQLAITEFFNNVPNEILIALPYLVVIVALALSGRGIRYPGAYLTPYRRH